MVTEIAHSLTHLIHRKTMSELLCRCRCAVVSMDLCVQAVYEADEGRGGEAVTTGMRLS